MSINVDYVIGKTKAYRDKTSIGKIEGVDVKLKFTFIKHSYFQIVELMSYDEERKDKETFESYRKANKFYKKMKKKYDLKEVD